MKRKFKRILLLIVLFLIIRMILYFYYMSGIEENNCEIQRISELKNEIGVIGEEKIYEVVDAGNNMQTLSVKEDIKFKVSLTGMLKNYKPKLQEIDEIIANSNLVNNGIYINEKSREMFFKLIAKFTNGKYEIDKQGYLKILDQSIINENDKKIINLINSNELLIIDFSSFCYIVDEVTGEVVDFPFEIMDPYQICQIYKQGNQSIMFVTTNSKQKLSDEEIFNEIF